MRAVGMTIVREKYVGLTRTPEIWFFFEYFSRERERERESLLLDFEDLAVLVTYDEYLIPKIAQLSGNLLDIWIFRYLHN